MDMYHNMYADIETQVGAGYWALRKTKYGSKLVKADRGPGIHVYHEGTRKPSVGHNERRRQILRKRKENENA